MIPELPDKDIEFWMIEQATYWYEHIDEPGFAKQTIVDLAQQTHVDQSQIVAILTLQMVEVDEAT